MSFLDRVLDPPSYGWSTAEGELIVPSRGQLMREALSRMNILRSRKNWLAFTNWFWTISLAPFLVVFALQYFSWPLVVAGFFYSMVGMGSYGTIWLHRYGTHAAYTIKSPFWRMVVRNLVIRVVPEEIYIVSHHVHHAKSDQPGDPYCSRAGALYCFLADTNHQPIAKDLSEAEYARVCRMLDTTGIKQNTYAEYLRWGSIARPLRTSLEFAGNWAFWYGVFYLAGGHALATAIFGSAMIWAVGIRTFNYASHGSGKNRQRDGIDFSRRDRSINQLWPGFVAGEWHNNHHLLCSSARNGFLWYQ
ncbi:MAG: fatty acid desaturase, partial [Sandaracinaceae bacterium]|nr:fatty acid desaturase [Sandaracinaceae bacterium]